MTDLEANPTLAKEVPALAPQSYHKELYKKEQVARRLRDWYLATEPSEIANLESKFREANGRLEDINHDHGLDRDVGTVPLESVYKIHKNLAEPLLKALQKDPTNMEALKQWNKIKNTVSDVNRKKHLETSWDFPPDYLNQRIGVADAEFIEYSNASSKGKEPDKSSSDRSSEDQQQSTQKRGSKKDQSNKNTKQPVDESQNNSEREDEGENDYSSDEESDMDDSLEGLGRSLEKKHPGMLFSGTVEGYRKCGSGYQCLVRYGAEDAPTFRLVPGASVGDWSSDGVINLVTAQRGNEKNQNGKWRYGQTHVLRLANVAWKPNQEIGENPLDSLHPELLGLQGNAVGCMTRVVWKDEQSTWETRTTIRRLIGRDQQKGDWIIYHRAEGQEKRYNKGNKQKQLTSISSATPMRSAVQPGSARRAGSTRLSTPHRASPGRRSNSIMDLYEDRPRDSIEHTPESDRFPSPARRGPTKSRGFRSQSEHYNPKLRERGYYDQGEDAGEFNVDTRELTNIVRNLYSMLESSRAGSSRSDRSVSFAGVD